MFSSNFKPVAIILFICLSASAGLLIANSALAACECSAGGAFGSHWTAPDACFSDSDCVSPCEHTFTGTGTPVDLISACTTTGGTTAPEGSAPSASGTTSVEFTSPIGQGTPSQLIGRAIKAVLGVIGAIALLIFVYGGFMWMTSSGSAERIKKAQTTLVWAVLGMIVIFAAYTAVDFVLSSLGV